VKVSEKETKRRFFLQYVCELSQNAKKTKFLNLNPHKSQSNVVIPGKDSLSFSHLARWRREKNSPGRNVWKGGEKHVSLAFQFSSSNRTTLKAINGKCSIRPESE
jgi:hypothetical protein